MKPDTRMVVDPLRHLLTVILVALLAACGDATGPDADVSSVTLVSSPGQAIEGSMPAEGIRFRVNGRDGGVVGAGVRVEVTGAEVLSVPPTSGADGFVDVRLRYGTPGAAVVRLFAGSTSQVASIQVLPDAVVGADIDMQSESLAAGSPLPGFTVHARHALDGPVTSQEVSWRWMGPGPIGPFNGQVQVTAGTGVQASGDAATVAGRWTLEVLRADGGVAANAEVVVTPLGPDEVRTVGDVLALAEYGTPGPLAFELVDRYGNPLAGEAWNVTGSGVAAPSGTTDESGRLSVSGWVPSPGEALTVTAGGVSGSFAYDARAAEAPDALTFELDIGTPGRPGASVPVGRVVGFRSGSPAAGGLVGVELPAEDGSPVRFTVRLDTEGEAQVPGFVLPRAVGSYAVRGAGVSGPLAELPFEVVREATWRVRTHYLIQATQNWERNVMLITNRGAVFRGFIDLVDGAGTDPLNADITARVRITRNGDVLFEGEQLGLPVLPSSSEAAGVSHEDWSRSFAIDVPESAIVPGMNVNYALLEGLDVVDSASYAPVVREGLTVDMAFLPVEIAATEPGRNVTEEDIPDWLRYRDMFPYAEYDTEILEEVVYDGPVGVGVNVFGGVNLLTREVYEGFNGQRVVVAAFDGRGTGQSTAGAAPRYVGWMIVRTDLNRNFYSPLLFHEFGHNHGLGHALCGTGGFEPTGPEPDGRLADAGYYQTGEMVFQKGIPLVMSYCWDRSVLPWQWTSPFIWNSVLENGIPNLLRPPTSLVLPGEPMLVALGVVDGAGLTLGSLNVLPLDEPVRGTDVRGVLRSVSGEELWSGSVGFDRVHETPMPPGPAGSYNFHAKHSANGVEHTHDDPGGTFALGIPLDAARAMSGAGGGVLEIRSGERSLTVPVGQGAPTVERDGDVIRWNTAWSPFLHLHYPSGQLRRVLTGGEHTLVGRDLETTPRLADWR